MKVVCGTIIGVSRRLRMLQLLACVLGKLVRRIVSAVHDDAVTRVLFSRVSGSGSSVDVQYRAECGITAIAQPSTAVGSHTASVTVLLHMLPVLMPMHTLQCHN
jgi:hypothetical protein